MAKYVTHDFYCINCGNKGISLQRKLGQQKERFHRKKLYCFNCKLEVNAIECRTPEDVEEFKANFKAGVYLSEAEESIRCSRPTGVWQKFLGLKTN